MNKVTGGKKQCSICGQMKPFSEFLLHNDKYEAMCKKCRYEYGKAYQKPYKDACLHDRSHRWTEEEISTLKSLYPTTKCLELCKILNVSSSALYHKAKSLGIRKFRKNEYS